MPDPLYVRPLICGAINAHMDAISRVESPTDYASALYRTSISVLSVLGEEYGSMPIYDQHGNVVRRIIPIPIPEEAK